jgi:hypothetical protein
MIEEIRRYWSHMCDISMSYHERVQIHEGGRDFPKLCESMLSLHISMIRCGPTYEAENILLRVVMRAFDKILECTVLHPGRKQAREGIMRE